MWRPKMSKHHHLGPTLAHLSSQWSRHGVAGQKGAGPFTIALSRQAGTEGTAVAQEVGKRLGWQVYDHELLERIAQEMNVREALLESVDERRQSWLLESA